MRFENDPYMRFRTNSPSNAWFICTLWLADYRIAVAKTKGDLKGALEILEWTVETRSAVGRSGGTGQSADGRTGFGFAAHVVAFDIRRDGDKLFEKA